MNMKTNHRDHHPSLVRSPFTIASTCASVPLSYVIISCRLCTLNNNSVVLEATSSASPLHPLTDNFSFNTATFARMS